MGIKYEILDKLREKKEDGLTVKELCKLLSRTENAIRGTINRDLKPLGLVKDTGIRRKGSKIFKLKEDKQGKPKIENNEFLRQLLKKNLEGNKFLMNFFQENKAKLQAKASKKQDDFKKLIDVMKDTRNFLEGDEK